MYHKYRMKLLYRELKMPCSTQEWSRIPPYEARETQPLNQHFFFSPSFPPSLSLCWIVKTPYTIGGAGREKSIFSYTTNTKSTSWTTKSKHSFMLLQRGEGGHHQGDQCDQGAAKSPKSRAVAALRPCVLDVVQASSHSF